MVAEFASKGVGNAGLSLGIVGTALSLLNNGIGGILGGGAPYSGTAPMVPSENQFVNRYEMEMENKLQNKESEIAILKSEKYTDDKLVEVYATLESKINAVKDAQSAINTQQAVFNATANSNLSCLANQVNQLASITKLIVPASNVCPQPMPLYNSWTTPSTTTTESST